ncbi:HalOD1 output domain-containing protein [Halopiger djelfimassiliensis]|uniref:HalOD1 output domain-containing protein n=1 Tax=Halopiger djelfimassiliensis TaxID=1293047 RepID=UPI001E396223|nr:HalOD1 output domain-containing protein [Halopiger djelfimassiliensis]
MKSQHSMTVAATNQRRPSMAVIDLVARADGADPIDLEPLYNAIDPDVLDTVCDSDSGFTSLEFEYQGHTVSVEASDGTLEISLEDAGFATDGTRSVADTESST